MLQKLSHLGIQAEFVEAIDGYTSQNKKEHQHYLEQPLGLEDSHHLEIESQRKLIKSPGAWGYLKTYLGILEDAKKRDFQRILCFDDDVLFHKDFENEFKKGVQDIPDDWKLLYLGASQYVWKNPQGLSYPDENKKEIDPNEPFYFPNRTDGAFAIGIDASAFHILIYDILRMNCPLDSGPLRSVMKASPKKCFVLNPNIVIADVSESDIRGGQEQQELAKLLKWDMDNFDFPHPLDLVSIIMPAYNAEKTIQKSIRSILIQSYPDIELIVVNDASSDNTVNIIKRIMEEDPRVRLISLPTNKGVASARNEGIKASNGEIISFQDADDISLKHRISYQLIPLYEKNMLFSVCRFYRSRCSMEELDINEQEATIELVKKRRLRNSVGIYEFRDQAIVGLVTGMYKRSTFETYGLFDEYRFAEDLEFVERILNYKTNQEFSNRFNGHTFLSEHTSIVNLFERIDIPLYVSSEMNENNLTVQYDKKEKESLLIQETFRKKYRSGGLNQFMKLSKRKKNTKRPTFKYNTLKINSIVVLPEIEHQILLSLINQGEEIKKENLTLSEIHNSFSWRITAPLRWVGAVVSSFIK
jgi:glycosyltransferase involved in cell wall biosynthesis